VPSPPCTLVKYRSWDDVTSSDLQVWANLDLAQVFISRMRLCTILCGSATALVLLAIFFGFLGHCQNDNKTIIACGLFILAGLSLGTGLVVFTSALSQTLMEIAQYHRDLPSGPLYEHSYGWCFFSASAAFIMANLAALFSIMGYINRFPSVDEMVRQTVPGAERKLREHQHLSTEYLVRHSGTMIHQYDPLPTDRSTYESESGPLLNRTPPGRLLHQQAAGLRSRGFRSARRGGGFPLDVAHTLAGQTVPITIKGRNTTAPTSFSDFPDKYGTIHCSGSSLQHGFDGAFDLESSATSGSYYGRSKTLQVNRNKKKCVAIETFQVPHSEFAEFGSKRTNDFGFSGSAV
ncbi:hypothetical protein NQ318_020628, partial [Aromia moschata]